jgi:hypothetical protein
MSDYRSEFEEFVDMWAEMEADSVVNPPIQKPEPSAFSPDVSGERAQDTYYDYLDSEELFQEDCMPNPVYPDSVGKDQDDPKSVWVNGSLLKEVEALKNRLFKVENQMARMGQGKKFSEKVHRPDDKRLFAEIKAIRERIDRVSNELGIKNEPSAWHMGNKKRK